MWLELTSIIALHALILVLFDPYIVPSATRWIEQVNLKVRATCGHPPELRGQRVKDVHVFKSCPGEKSPIQHPKPTKATKTESALIRPAKVKTVKPNMVQKSPTKKSRVDSASL